MKNRFSTKTLSVDAEDISRESDFLDELEVAYRDVYAYVLSIVGNRNDADDVVQEVCAILWQRFDDFDSSRNFRKWACGYAFRVAKDFVRRKRRQRGGGLTDDVLAKISVVQTAGQELFELRREILDQCLTKLQSKDRTFLMGCYSRRTSLIEFARAQGVPIASVYTRLKRIRRSLVDCVSRSLGRNPGN